MLGGPDLLAYLVLALGAAMAVGSVLALVRPPDARQEGDLERAPVGRSIAASIDRARDILGYTPRYSSLDALHESLRWLAANGHVNVGGQDF